MPNAYDPFTLEVQRAVWDSIPTQTVIEDQAFELDLNNYLPTDLQWTIGRKASSSALPSSLTLGANGIITGTQTSSFSTRSLIFVASGGGLSIESDPVEFRYQYAPTIPRAGSFPDLDVYATPGSSSILGGYDETINFYVLDGSPDVTDISINRQWTYHNASISTVNLTYTPLPARSGTIRLDFDWHSGRFPDQEEGALLIRVDVAIRNRIGTNIRSALVYEQRR